MTTRTLPPNVAPGCFNVPGRNDDGFEELCHLVDDDPEAIATALDEDERDIAIASHMPLLPLLLQRLTTGRDDIPAAFPLNGCVAIERTGARWEERWRMEP